MDECRIRQDSDHVIIRFKNAESRVPYGAALEIAQAIAAAARQAEAFAKQNRMIADGALLEKQGFPKELIQGVILDQATKRGGHGQ